MNLARYGDMARIVVIITAINPEITYFVIVCRLFDLQGCEFELYTMRYFKATISPQ